MSTIELAVGRLRSPHPARRAAPKPKASPPAPVLPLPSMPIKTRILCDYAPDDPVPPRPAAPAAAAGTHLLAAASAVSALLGAGFMYAVMTATRVAEAPPPAARVAAVSAPLPAKSEATSGAVQERPAAQVTESTVAAAPAAAAAATVGAQDLEDAERAIFAWATAWSERDAEHYLAAYSAAFKPDKGLTREAWEGARRKRLAGARSIAVTIRNLQVEPVARERIIARFAQDYAADNYRERGTPKMLVLVREGGAWRIAAEVEDARGAGAG